MDHQYAQPSLEWGLDSGYSLRLLNDEDRPLWVPGLVHWYLVTSRYDDSYKNMVHEGLENALIYLLERQGKACGFVAFDCIGIRQTAQIHLAFWGPVSSARRFQAIARACQLTMETFDLLRIEAYIDSDRPDVIALAEGVGGLHVGTMPQAASRPNGEMYSQELYVLRR